MHHRYFPPCLDDGEICPPVEFNHLGVTGRVPKKCSQCEHLFEGGCARAMPAQQDWLWLDHGPCGVSGATHAVRHQDVLIRSAREIPKKCASCQYLSADPVYDGFKCSKDPLIWGQYPRGLDWGEWTP